MCNIFLFKLTGFFIISGEGVASRKGAQPSPMLTKVFFSFFSFGNFLNEVANGKVCFLGFNFLSVRTSRLEHLLCNNLEDLVIASSILQILNLILEMGFF